MVQRMYIVQFGFNEPEYGIQLLCQSVRWLARIILASLRYWSPVTVASALGLAPSWHPK